MKIVKIPKREEGQGLVEYALILVLVAIVVIVILTQIGSLIVLAFATIIGSFTGQQVTGSGQEGVVVSESTGANDGVGNCQLDASNVSFVLVQDGNIITDSTETVIFTYGGSGGGSDTVTIDSSGVGTADLGPMSGLCPANLRVASW